MSRRDGKNTPQLNNLRLSGTESNNASDSGLGNVETASLRQRKKDTSFRNIGNLKIRGCI